VGSELLCQSVGFGVAPFAYVRTTKTIKNSSTNSVALCCLNYLGAGTLCISLMKTPSLIGSEFRVKEVRMTCSGILES